MSPALHLVRSVVNRFVRIGCVSISVLFYIILSCRISRWECKNRRKISAGLFQFDHNGLVVGSFIALCHIRKNRTVIAALSCQVVKAVNEILSGHRLSVGPGDIISQGKGPGQFVIAHINRCCLA